MGFPQFATSEGRMKKLFATTAIAIFAAMPAFAGSPIVEAEVVPVTPVNIADRWEGAYIGAYLGYIDSNNQDMMGIIAGYNRQNGSLVFGGEIDAMARNNGTPRVFFNGRAGYAFGDSTLVFAKFGLRPDGAGPLHKTVGIGGEYAVNDNFSVRLDLERHSEISNDIFHGHGAVKLGVVWGF